MVKKEDSFKIIIIAFLVTIMISCQLNSNNEKTLHKNNIEYDGYVEPNSLSPEYFKGKYFSSIKVNVKSNNQYHDDSAIKC